MSDSVPNQHEIRAWADHWAQRLLAGVHAGDVPEAVLVLGQPGAGKGTIIEILCRYFSDKGQCVALDPEELVLSHPQFLDTVEANPETVNTDLLPVAHKLIQGMLEVVRSKTFHVLLENIVTDPEHACQCVSELKECGYTVTVMTLVVEPQESWQAFTQRQSELSHYLGTDWQRPRTYHDQAIAKLPALLNALQKSALVDRMVFLTRKGERLDPPPSPGTIQCLTDLLRQNMNPSDQDPSEETQAEPDKIDVDPTFADSTPPTAPNKAHKVLEDNAKANKPIRLSDGRRIHLGKVKAKPTPPATSTESTKASTPSSQGGSKPKFRINIKPTPGEPQTPKPAATKPVPRAPKVSPKPKVRVSPAKQTPSQDPEPVVEPKPKAPVDVTPPESVNVPSDIPAKKDASKPIVSEPASAPPIRPEILPTLAPEPVEEHAAPTPKPEKPLSSVRTTPVEAQTEFQPSADDPMNAVDAALRYQRLSPAEKKKVDQRKRLQEKLRKAAYGGGDED